jgi:hypothetical protein
MPEPRTRHLPNSTTLFCIGTHHSNLAGTLQNHGVDLMISEITELEDRQ